MFDIRGNVCGFLFVSALLIIPPENVNAAKKNVNLIPVQQLLLLAGGGPHIRLLKDINPGPSSSEPEELFVWNGVLFLGADDGVHGNEVWKSDGTEGGTVLLKDIHVGPGRSNGYDFVGWNRNFTPMGNSLYFAATDSNYRAGLWKTDGTSNGTSEVHSISPDNLIVYNNELYFTGYDGSDTELWKSDGTANGTEVVKNISENHDSYAGDNGFIIFNNELYFRAANTSTNTPPESCGLWKTNGTEDGTVAVKPGTLIDPTSRFAVCNNALYFVAEDGSYPNIWKTDGTPENTVKVSTHKFAETSNRFIEYNGSLYITINDGYTGRELWKIDCTTDIESPVKDIYPGSDSGNPADFFVYANSMYFRANTADNGVEFWKTDGTEAGTMMVKDIYPGVEGSYPEFIVEYNGKLYFAAEDGVNGDELWWSDGTEAGTKLLKDVNPGPDSGSPYELTPVNGKLLFTAEDSENGWELWMLR